VEKGDIIICKTNKSIAFPGLTMDHLIIDKHYVVERETDYTFNVPVITIKNEKGFISEYDQRYFLSLPEYRKLKINKICSKLGKV
jgi:hypothetical protein